MTSTTVSATLDTLCMWFGTHGIPEQLFTDNGPQFTADALKEFTEFAKSIYHTASNGLAERFKSSLNDGQSLTQWISSYLLTYRTMAHASFS